MSAGYPPRYSPGSPPQGRRPNSGAGAPGPWPGGGVASRSPGPPYSPNQRPVAPPPRPPRAGRIAGTPAAPRTDPSLYEWDRLTTAQQQAVLRTIQGSQRDGPGRILRGLVLLLVVVGMLAALAFLAVVVFHLGGFGGIKL